MAEKSTFIKIDRNILQWRWYHDLNTKSLFLHLLLKANIRDCDFEKITVHRGQLVTSLKSLSKELGVSVMSVRTSLSHLESTREITSKTYSKYRLITIENYNAYQDNQQGNQQASNKQVTSNQQASNNNQRSKEEKKERILSYGANFDAEVFPETPPSSVSETEKAGKRYGVKQNVILTDRELLLLQNDFPDWQEKIDHLSEYMSRTGRGYANHSQTIRKWAKEDGEKKPAASGGLVAPSFTQDDFVDAAVARAQKILSDLGGD